MCLSNSPDQNTLVFRNWLQSGLKQQEKEIPFWLNNTVKGRSVSDFYVHFRNTLFEYNNNTNLKDLNPV